MERDELLERVSAETLATRNPALIAQEASAGRFKLVERFSDEQTVVAALGIPAGEAFIAALEALVNNPLAEDHPLRAYQAGIKRQMAFLKTTGIDVGSVVTQGMLDTLAALNILDNNSVDQIKGLAKVADPVSETEVRAILWDRDGFWTLGEE